MTQVPESTNRRIAQVSTAVDQYMDFVQCQKGQVSTHMSALLPEFELQFQQKATSKADLFSIARIFAIFLLKKSTPLVRTDAQSKVVFWPFQFYHCKFMIPVIKEFRKRNLQIEVITFRNDISRFLAEAGVTSQTVSFLKETRQFSDFVLRFIEIVNMIFCLFKMVFKAPGILKPLLTTIGSLNDTEKYHEMAVVSSSTQQSYHMIGYDLSVVGRSLIHVFNSEGLVTGRIQTGVPNYFLSGYSCVSQLFLWDNISQSIYERRGYTGSAYVVGNQLMDLKNENTNEGFRNYLQPHLGRHKASFFVAFSGPGHNTTDSEHVAIVDILCSIVEELHDHLFVIKLHAKDDSMYYERILNRKNVIVSNYLNLVIRPDALDILLQVDALITGSSAVALDAISLGKKIVCIDPDQIYSHRSYVQPPYAITISEILDMHKIRTYLHDTSLGYTLPSSESLLGFPSQQICRIVETQIKDRIHKTEEHAHICN